MTESLVETSLEVKLSLQNRCYWTAKFDGDAEVVRGIS